MDALQIAEAEHLRGQIALDQRRAGDAARLLLSPARRLEPLSAGLARETHLEALGTAKAGTVTALQTVTGLLTPAVAAAILPLALLVVTARGRLSRPTGVLLILAYAARVTAALAR